MHKMMLNYNKDTNPITSVINKYYLNNTYKAKQSSTNLCTVLLIQKIDYVTFSWWSAEVFYLLAQVEGLALPVVT